MIFYTFYFSSEAFTTSIVEIMMIVLLQDPNAVLKSMKKSGFCFCCFPDLDMYVWINKQTNKENKKERKKARKNVFEDFPEDEIYLKNTQTH